jgi:hypothetical protein
MKLCEEDIRISAAELSFLFPVDSDAHKLEIKFHYLSLQSKRINFHKFKSGGLYETHAVATCNLGNHLSICLKTGKNQETLYRNGRSQDLPDAH